MRSRMNAGRIAEMLFGEKPHKLSTERDLESVKISGRSASFGSRWHCKPLP